MDNIISNLEKKLKSISNKEDKIKMENYLKNNFTFYGIRKGILKLESKQIINYSKKITFDEMRDLINILIKKEEREWTYIIIFILESNISKFNSSDRLDFIKNLIITKPWWESVDSYSGIVLSKILLKFYDHKFIEVFLKEMNTHENFWMKRASLLCQLKFRDKTDFELQKELILNICDNKIFWIQKAIGWSLRQYSEFGADEVREFVIENKEKFSNLAVKESLRKII